MRTDVKVGLICAFAIVLCVVIYFVARGNKRPPVDPTPSQPTLLTSTTPDPAIPAASAPSSAVGGGLIGLPGTSTPATPALGSSSPTPGGLSSPTTPGMGPSLATSGTPTGPVFGTPSTVIPSSPSPATVSPAATPTPTYTPTMDVLPVPGSFTPGLALPAGPTTHKIQQGDMLGAISRKYGVSVAAIKTANPGLDPNRLPINTVIKIPAPTPVAAATPATPRPVAASPATPAAARPVAASPATPAAARPVAAATPRPAPAIKPGSTYKVKKGDTLITIAKAAYGTADGNWQKIFRANRTELTDPNVVPVGAQIVIPR